MYFSYSLLPLLNLTLRWPSLLPSPYIVLGLRSSPPPPLHAHTTLSHSTTQPFATLLLSTPARLVSRIQVKSINQARACAPQKPWGEHCALHQPLQHPSTAPFIPFTSPSILATEVSYVNRRIREAIHISRHHPKVNRDRGWVLLDN